MPPAPDQSSQFGSSRPLALARAIATGPAICAASNKVGANTAPATAPTGPPTAAPAAPPAIREAIEPANCPACSMTALGKNPTS